MAKVRPTVGRSVHYYTNDSNKFYNQQGRGPYPALVLQVAGEGTPPEHDSAANLKVFHWGGEYDVGHVYEKAQAEALDISFPYWVWPPRE